MPRGPAVVPQRWLVDSHSNRRLLGRLLDSPEVPYLIFAAALGVRITAIFWLKTYLHPDPPAELVRVALSLARYGSFANPYSMPTGATAHVAPAYPIWLAMLFRLFGTGVPGELAQEISSSILAALQYALLPVVAKAFGVPWRAGALVGFVGAVLPMNLGIEVSGTSEAVLAAIALMLLTLRTESAWLDHSHGIRDGLLWGLAFLCSPALIPVCVGLNLLGLVWAKTRWSYARYCLAAALAALVCMLPWGLRNYFQLGSFILTRSDFGLEMHVSNNDQAWPVEPQNNQRGLYQAVHPFLNRGEASAVREMGEVGYNRACLAEAVLWIRTHPVRFLRLTAERILYTWFPYSGQGPWRAVMKLLLTLVAFGGLVALWTTDRRKVAVFTVCLASYTAIYAFFQVDGRYRYPIDWILLLAAGHAGLWVYGRLHREAACAIQRSALIAPLGE